MQELTLSVPDMSCQHCVNTIDKALTQLPGVEQVQVDLATKLVQVQYQPEQIASPQMEGAVSNAGYTVADVKSTPMPVVQQQGGCSCGCQTSNN
ncbi:heavy-metal-associated domain-containing protein [Ktedonobacter racemifer]|uniref:Copper chaperone CopZ n=1 Tax=Ktedonobacter racemifer DSM 44963 TaxID=485913 RepID=D6TE51_KTERA|nr:heavy-metal-associated domain-containing protein [Ktedonobacter racemifer]EFH88424.1 Heavy metal transport/detoxification protein [Ktedonobacter racemifer DSM 44963]